VGTITEIHDYLRLLYARAGTPYCPDHGLPLQAQSVAQMVDAVLALPADTRLMVLAPVVRDRKGEFAELFADMQARGYVRFRIGSGGGRPVVVEADALPALKKTEKHDIDVVIDRLRVRPDMKQRLAESFEAALRIADGRAIALEMPGDVGGQEQHLFSNRFACPVCSYALPELEPRLFSFNSPVGACPPATAWAR
jgi:excinuclease ABC subunit A